MIVRFFGNLAFRVEDLVSLQVVPAVRYSRCVPTSDGDVPPREPPPNIPPRLELTFANRHKMQVCCGSQEDAMEKFDKICRAMAESIP